MGKNPRIYLTLPPLLDMRNTWNVYCTIKTIEHRVKHVKTNIFGRAAERTKVVTQVFILYRVHPERRVIVNVFTNNSLRCQELSVKVIFLFSFFALSVWRVGEEKWAPGGQNVKLIKTLTPAPLSPISGCEFILFDEGNIYFPTWLGIFQQLSFSPNGGSYTWKWLIYRMKSPIEKCRPEGTEEHHKEAASTDWRSYFKEGYIFTWRRWERLNDTRRYGK